MRFFSFYKWRYAWYSFLEPSVTLSFWFVCCFLFPHHNETPKTPPIHEIGCSNELWRLCRQTKWMRKSLLFGTFIFTAKLKRFYRIMHFTLSALRTVLLAFICIISAVMKRHINTATDVDWLFGFGSRRRLSKEHTLSSVVTISLFSCRIITLNSGW